MESKIINHFKFRKDFYDKDRELLHINYYTLLLELGCGARPTYELTYQTIGLDLVPQLLQVFKTKHADALLILGDVRYIPIRNGVIPLVISNMLLHHIVSKTIQKSDFNTLYSIKEMKRVVKKEGLIRIREWLAINNVYKIIMFYVTYITSIIKIDIPLFGIYKGVVTNFLTIEKIYDIAKKLKLKGKIYINYEWRLARARRMKIGYNAWIEFKNRMH